MSLGKHSKNPISMRIRKERSDALIKNLKPTYPALKGVNGNKKLGTLEKELGVTSLSQALRILQKKGSKK